MRRPRRRSGRASKRAQDSCRANHHLPRRAHCVDNPGVAEPTFEQLQARLVPLWKSIERLNQDEQTIVVVPALTVDAGDLKGAKLQAYEERFLFLLLLLRQPRARLVYVTSNPILPSVVDYYLDLL